MDRAACSGQTDLMFAVHNTGIIEAERVWQAKRLCAGCEVAVPCLEAALAANEPYGIWGGLTAQERRAAQGRIANTPRQAPEESKHGTRWTYQKGCRCLECGQANAKYVRKRRRLALLTEGEQP